MKLNKVFIATTLLIIAVASQSIAQDQFAFIQLCDTQLGMKNYASEMEQFEQAVEKANALNADLVVICGDLVHHASDSAYADFLNIKNKLSMPCYLVAGNHDVGKEPDNSSLSYYRNKIGKDYYHFEHKGYSFVVINTQLLKTNVPGESKKHYRWLKKTLRQMQKEQQPVIVAGHYPIYHKDPKEEDNYFNFPLKKRQHLLDLFVKSNVKAYLSGHKHELIINQYKGIQLVSGETTSNNFDKRPFGFRLWEASKDTLMHGFIPLKADN